jgi:hypothetical protein
MKEVWRIIKFFFTPYSRREYKVIRSNVEEIPVGVMLKHINKHFLSYAVTSQLTVVGPYVPLKITDSLYYSFRGVTCKRLK